MWLKIVEKFRDSPQRLKVAETLIRHGFHIDEVGIIKCGDIRIPLKAIADALGVYRRTVRATTEDIWNDPELMTFFCCLRPAGPSLEKVSRVLGYGVVAIYAESPENPGILSKVASTIASFDIAIRQVLAEGVGIFREPCVRVITEEPLPGDAIEILTSIKGVNKVVIEL